MTTTQVAPDGHHSFPPPCSVESPTEINSADLPTDQDNNNHFPASSYHVPPKVFAPRAHAYRRDDYLDRPKIPTPLPDRCQFMFSDGRQCTMARSDIHPSLCFYHSDREEQLFGDPSCRCEARKLDFPELYSASRDLSTAAGVNRALAQVFRLLAQRRISRQEAATFAKLAHLLLQSIRAASQEQPMTDVVEWRKDLAANVYQQDELRGAKEVDTALFAQKDDESKDLSASPPHCDGSRLPMRPSAECVIPKTSSPIPAPSSSATHAPVRTSTPPIAASPEPPAQRVAVSNSRKISTSAASTCNSPEISTYKNVELEPVQNQHLHTNAP